MLIVRGARPVGRVAVLPVWQRVTLIRDEITDAKTGVVPVNANMLVGGIGFLRVNAFSGFAVATEDKQ